MCVIYRRFQLMRQTLHSVDDRPRWINEHAGLVEWHWLVRLKYSGKKTCHSANFFETDPTRIGLESNGGLRDERQEAGYLTCAMTTMLYWIDAKQNEILPKNVNVNSR
jgi:hypothetical protein